MTGEDVRKTLSKRIKQLRNNKQYSQSQLSELADVSVPFLSAIERGTKWPYPDTLAKIANALDVSVSDLFLDETNHLSKKENEISIFKEFIEGQNKILTELLKKYFMK